MTSWISDSSAQIVSSDMGGVCGRPRSGSRLTSWRIAYLPVKIHILTISKFDVLFFSGDSAQMSQTCVSFEARQLVAQAQMCIHYTRSLLSKSKKWKWTNLSNDTVTSYIYRESCQQFCCVCTSYRHLWSLLWCYLWAPCSAGPGRDFSVQWRRRTPRGQPPDSAVPLAPANLSPSSQWLWPPPTATTGHRQTGTSHFTVFTLRIKSFS